MTFFTPKLRLLTCAVALSQLILFSNAEAGLFGLGSKKGEGYVPESVDGCKRISEASKITGTKALVIGYEGLGSSSWINANSLVSYRDKLAHGQKAHRPLFLFGGSFLTRGPLVRIVEAYKNKVEVLVFWRTNNQATSPVPAQCAKIWMGAGDPDRKVIIVGHSFGGGAAWLLADSLRKLNVPVAGVVTADPRPARCGGECWPSGWSKPQNVSDWENCWQSAPLRGQQVPGANNHYQGAIGHVNIQNTSCVYNGISNIISGVKGSLTTEPLKYVASDSDSSSGDAGSLPSDITGTKKSSTLTGGAQASAKLEKPASFLSRLFGSGDQTAPSKPLIDQNGDYTVRSAAGASGGAASALAQHIEGPAVVHYTKPGGGDPQALAHGSALNGTGSSRPAAIAQAGAGGSAAGGVATDAGSREPSAVPASAHVANNGSDATSAAGALWAGGIAPGSAPQAAPALPLLNESGGVAAPAPAGLGGDSFTAAPGSASPEVSGFSSASPAEPGEDLSLFERVHAKITKIAPKS